MTLTTDGYLGALAGMPDRSEIEAVLARRFNYLGANGDVELSGHERADAHSAKGKGATSVDGRA
jgi:hypothetical protein